MKEEWRDIVGYEGIYQVSNTGLVRSLDRLRKHKGNNVVKIKGVTLKGYVSDSTGYRMVGLSKNGNAKTFTVHRLTATHFLENIKNKPQVNHIDCDKLNNRIDNLEWSTSSENTKHAYDNNLIGILRGEKRKNSKLKDLEVIEIRERLSRGEMVKDVAKNFGVSRQVISKIKSNITWRHLLKD